MGMETFVTNEQIEALRRDAQEDGDDALVVTTFLALELDAHKALGPNGFEERFGGGGLCLSPAAERRLARMTRAPGDPRDTGGSITCESLEDLALFLYEEQLIARGVIQ